MIRWKGENVSTAEVEGICSSVIGLQVENVKIILIIIMIILTLSRQFCFWMGGEVLHPHPPMITLNKASGVGKICQ